MKLSRDEVDVLILVENLSIPVNMSPKIHREMARAWDMQNKYPYRSEKKKNGKVMMITFEEKPKSEWRYHG
jgi:hypothetical protein